MPAIPKPLRGQHVLDLEAVRAEYKKTLEGAKKSAKLRDSFACRWPEIHKCRGLLEGAHLIDASLGGEPIRSNIICLCAWIHRRGPQSIHGKQLRIEPETEHGADGPLSFYREDGNGEWTCVGVETAVHVLRKN